MFERFTDRARRVLVLAQEEARLLKHSFIGTEHILLGLIQEGEGVAAEALEAIGISLEAVRERAIETVARGETAPPGSPPFTPRAKRVLELALREALQLGHNYIGTEHMLLGLVREGEGAGAQVLRGLGADLSRVRQQVIDLLAGRQGRLNTDVPGELSEGQGSVGFELVERFRPIGEAPFCARCGSRLEGNLRYRELSAEAEGSTETETIRIHYCVKCGNAIEGSSMSGISQIPRSFRPNRGLLRNGPPVADPEDDTSLEGQFQLRCRELITEIQALGFNPGGWIERINRLGACGAAKDLIERGTVLPVTHWLVDRNRPDLAMEYEICQSRWNELFTDDDRSSATHRLEDSGGQETNR